MKRLGYLKKKTFIMLGLLWLTAISCSEGDEIEENLNYVPRIDIKTGGVEITSTDEYVETSVIISNCTDNYRLEARGKIRGRGHSSWELDKKPYKLKFDDKQSPFGFPANRDWALLAEVYDRSMLRTAYMCELSKAAGMAFPLHYQHVDLYLNNKYIGMYLLIDHVEKAKQRVNIEDDGFIMKFDAYFNESPVFLHTHHFWRPYTFKYPDADKGNIVEDDENFDFISSFMNDMEEALMELDDNPESIEYLKYINIHSFAKWYLVAELTGVVNCNQYFVLPSKSATLETYPFWDMEWSMGLWPSAEWGEETDDLETVYRWRYDDYFEYLFKSKLFIDTVKQEWFAMKSNIPTVREKIRSLNSSIAYSQEENLEEWEDYLTWKLNVVFDTWQEEVNYVNGFFERRLLWLNQQISQL